MFMMFMYLNWTLSYWFQTIKVGPSFVQFIKYICGHRKIIHWITQEIQRSQGRELFLGEFNTGHRWLTAMVNRHVNNCLCNCVRADELRWLGEMLTGTTIIRSTWIYIAVCATVRVDELRWLGEWDAYRHDARPIRFIHKKTSKRIRIKMLPLEALFWRVD